MSQVIHRCKLSRAGWGLAAFLAAYVLFMHSNFFAERRGLWHTVHDHAVSECQAAARTEVQLLVGLQETLVARVDALEHRDKKRLGSR